MAESPSRRLRRARPTARIAKPGSGRTAQASACRAAAAICMRPVSLPTNSARASAPPPAVRRSTLPTRSMPPAPGKRVDHRLGLLALMRRRQHRDARPRQRARRARSGACASSAKRSARHSLPRQLAAGPMREHRSARRHQRLRRASTSFGREPEARRRRRIEREQAARTASRDDRADRPWPMTRRSRAHKTIRQAPSRADRRPGPSAAARPRDKASANAARMASFRPAMRCARVPAPPRTAAPPAGPAAMVNARRDSARSGDGTEARSRARHRRSASP